MLLYKIYCYSKFPKPFSFPDNVIYIVMLNIVDGEKEITSIFFNTHMIYPALVVNRVLVPVLAQGSTAASQARKAGPTKWE